MSRLHQEQAEFDPHISSVYGKHICLQNRKSNLRSKYLSPVFIIFYIRVLSLVKTYKVEISVADIVSDINLW